MPADAAGFFEARAQATSKICLGNWRGLRQAVSRGSPIRFLLFLAFFVTFGTANFEAIFGLFMLDKHSYGPEQVGAILMLVGVVALIGRGLLTGIVTKWWGEPNVILISLLAGSIGFVLLLLAQSYAAVLITTGFCRANDHVPAAVDSLAHIAARHARPRRGDGPQQLVGESGARHRAVVGRSRLRSQSRLSVCQRRTYSVQRLDPLRGVAEAGTTNCHATCCYFFAASAVQEAIDKGLPKTKLFNVPFRMEMSGFARLEGSLPVVGDIGVIWPILALRTTERLGVSLGFVSSPQQTAQGEAMREWIVDAIRPVSRKHVLAGLQGRDTPDTPRASANASRAGA